MDHIPLPTGVRMPFPEHSSRTYNYRHDYDDLGHVTSGFVCSNQCDACKPSKGLTRDEHNNMVYEFLNALEKYVDGHDYKVHVRSVTKLLTSKFGTPHVNCPYIRERSPFVIRLDLKDMLLTDLTLISDLRDLRKNTKIDGRTVAKQKHPVGDKSGTKEMSTVLDSVLFESLTPRPCPHLTCNMFRHKEEWIKGSIASVMNSEYDSEDIQLRHESFPRVMMEGQRITIRGSAPIGASITLILMGFAKHPQAEEAVKVNKPLRT